MQNLINKTVGFLIRLFSKLADKEPAEWLVDKAFSAGLNQTEFSNLLEVV